MSDCQHEPQITADPSERDIGGMVAVDDRVQILPRHAQRIWPCKHCGAPLDMGHDPRRRVTRSWLVERGYEDPFADQ